MIKRRGPQEIADFFGCKVRVNPYTYNTDLWDANDEIKGCVGYLNHQLIHMSNMDDDKFMYEPQKKQENSGNKGGIVVEHLKEVFFYQAMVRGI